jgi:arsenate reductase (thioredoxin)
MTEQPLRILFLCTHNSARSILAEALLNHLGQGRLQGFSAGSAPREHQRPHPLGLLALEAAGVPTTGLHSKSWDVFAAPGALPMDLVITVCDSAAGEACPFWPGQPATAHWSYADPSAGDGDDAHKLLAFKQTLNALHQRIDRLVRLKAAQRSPGALQASARALAAE